METVKTLTCKFKDSEGRQRNVAIDAPIEPVDEQVLKDFMNAAITHNVLQLAEDDASIMLTSIIGAEVTVRTTSDIDLTI